MCVCVCVCVFLLLLYASLKSSKIKNSHKIKMGYNGFRLHTRQLVR